jgi:hypothetical protein
LSDHLGVEALVKLHPVTSLASSADNPAAADPTSEAEASTARLGGGQ